MKARNKLGDAFWWLIDAVAIVAGSIILILLILGIPSFIINFISGLWKININLGEVFMTLVIIAIFIGIGILNYWIKDKFDKWREKRNSRCNICQDKMGGTKHYEGYGKYYHFECAKKLVGRRVGAKA